ncbi:YihY/virulence factor BrkB family protein [Bacillus songklensis]|uniref:YihY/virulence factor BrkB family protein n=1 Tax=Bacillus songklensis TaxID=1069116 RepID=A0ABV8B5C2_9BACI
MENINETNSPSWLKELVWRFQRDEISRLAAELAYYFLLSLFPFLIFLITLIGFFPLEQKDVLNLISEFAPKQTMKMIETNVNTIIGSHNEGLLSFGIIATIWSASNGINAIVRAFNRAYEVEESRSFIVARGMAVMLTTAMIFVIITALLLPVFGKMIGLYLFSTFGLSVTFLAIWSASRWIVSAIILFIVFTGLYYFAPNKHLKLKEVVRGSAFATFGWMIASLAFSYYVGNFGNYTATYGSLGGIIILMVWLYISGMIIVIGGEINAIYYQKNVIPHE